MTKEKMNELYEKSQEIVTMMEELGIKEYKGDLLKSISFGTFLTLNNIYISSSLSDTYIDDNLNKFMPTTTLEIMIQFNDDINNDKFVPLEELYQNFTKR
ncbi:hypothetical protein [Sebaldella termitidis]|uniref:hypothetical protein n=1 Tax=Sebaldella termitidis TaxID=826 RepID=UPI003EC08AB9